MKYIFIITISFILMSNAICRVFGPSNYDECMLEKMKGQQNNMRSFAENSCEIEFPMEKLLNTDIWSQYLSNSTSYAEIKYEYKKVKKDYIDVNITNNSNYKISKIRVITKDNCDKKYITLDNVEVVTSSATTTFTAKVQDASQIKCVEVLFYGKRYK